MDDKFFQQLDEALTNVGSDKYWERKIGGHVVWLSPVPFKSQHKVNELLTQELGSNVVGEVKRMTLSYAIVGFDGHDLRPYRNEIAQFPTIDPRDSKKQLKVALHKYLSYKMEEWGTEWVDSAFEVFADIMESVKKENLKEVKFENAKDKREELAELEEKVRDIRFELEMPRLVEEKPESEVPEKTKSEPEPEPDPAVEKSKSESPSFNPFQKLPTAAAEFSAPQSLVVPVTPVLKQKPIEMDETTSSPDKPYVATRHDDVVEERAVKEPSAPIEIDPNRQSVNPRFKQVR